jgi:hypothetical protein
MANLMELEQKDKIEKLREEYRQGEDADKELFAEMRSNLLLVNGDHYNRGYWTYFNRRLRDTKDISQDQKLRLTKNHIQNISSQYVNMIVSTAPGVGFAPKNERELHDQKAAEMHHSVWRDAVNRFHLEDATADWADSYVNVGEVHVKMFWDSNSGYVTGYSPAQDEDGTYLVNEFGEHIPDEEKPQMSGGMIFEEVYGFNLIRPAEAKEMHSAKYLTIRKMIGKKDAVIQFAEACKERNLDPEKVFNATNDETFTVFDNSKAQYTQVRDQCMLFETYYRPCLEYPSGYYVYWTKEGVFLDGELPGGIFPIVSRAYNKVKTTPRGRSIIKHMRPYQVEINRAASKMAEHQITLGDDKIILQNGSKMSAGVTLPGVRSVHVTGMEPKIMAGRDGSQYMNYMTSQITELYNVMGMPEKMEDAQEGTNLDPYVLLYRAASKKKRFQLPIKGFESFLIEVAKTFLMLAKHHYPDDYLVNAVGKQEQVNIAEFRDAPDTAYDIKIEAQSEDIETKLGQQIVMNHALQYIGGQLTPDQIGKIMNNMPFSNSEGSFNDLTMDDDLATNDILALDRGERPPVNLYDNHPYLIKRFVGRVRQADFKFLPQPVQQNYAMKIQTHEQMEAQRQLAIQRAKSGYIPTDGYLVSCDFYLPNTDPEKTPKRARVPSNALSWLLKQLEVQGQAMGVLDGMNGGAVEQIADMLPGGNGEAPATPPSQGAVNASAMAGGA